MQVVSDCQNCSYYLQLSAMKNHMQWITTIQNRVQSFNCTLTAKVCSVVSKRGTRVTVASGHASTLVSNQLAQSDSCMLNSEYLKVSNLHSTTPLVRLSGWLWQAHVITQYVGIFSRCLTGLDTKLLAKICLLFCLLVNHTLLWNQ